MTMDHSRRIAARLTRALAVCAQGGVLALAATLAADAKAGDCYVLSYAPDGLIGPPAPVRQGTPLSDAEKKGVQAAIDMIKKWEEDCGVTGTGGGGGGGGLLAQGPGAHLGGMLTNGDICKEIAADAKKTGATASNPVTGNGHDGKGTWDTFGHPGINIGDPYIPKATDDGKFESGDCKFDTADVANLAAMLLHEYQHLTDPPANPGSEGDYEAPAYTYAAEQLCKVAGCDAASKAEKKVACEWIKLSNQQLCKYCKPQVECEACDEVGIDVEAKCKPPKEEREPVRTRGGNDALAGPVVVAFPGPVDTQLYAEDGHVGTLSLRASSNTLRIALYDQDDAYEHLFDFDSLPALKFDAQAFAQLEQQRVMVVGKDRATGEGEIVEVLYDVALGVVAVNTVYQGGDFVGALDATSYDLAPGLPGIFVLDSAHELSVYLPWAALVLPLATPATAPDLVAATNVSVRPVPIAGAPGFVAITSDASDQYLDNGLLVNGMSLLIDVDLDGVIDLVY